MVITKNQRFYRYGDVHVKNNVLFVYTKLQKKRAHNHVTNGRSMYQLRHAHNRTLLHV